MTGDTLSNVRVYLIQTPGIISYESIGIMLTRQDDTLVEVQKYFGVN